MRDVDSTSPPVKAVTGRLVIVRHGESEWNALGKWTGTTDVHLTAKGYHEAALMGEMLADIHFTYAYASQQIRTHETLFGILDAARQPAVPYEFSAALNERNYGIYTGKNKWEVQQEVGKQYFHDLRRGWDVPVAGGETLKMVYERVIPFYLFSVLPRLQDGQTVLLTAQGNSIRSMVKYIERVPDEAIGDIEMIFGEALLYTVDGQGRMIAKEVRRIKTTPPPA